MDYKKLLKNDRPKSKGVSVTLTTVILTSILLTTLGIALFISTTVIEYHTQSTEYENAQNLITYLADAVEQVSLGSGGARYVRFSLRTTRLDFVRDYYGELEIKLNDNTIIRDNPDALIIRGGNLLTAPPFQVLYPEGITDPASELNKYIVEVGEPVTLVYQTYEQGPATILLCKRVRVGYLGVYNVLENNELKQYNAFEIVYINITIGRTGGVETIPVIARNRNVTLTTYYISDNSFTLSVYLNGQLVDQKTFSGISSAEGSMIIVRVAHTELSTLGG